MTQNLSRLLANKRLVPGTRHEWTVLDPATLQSAKVSIRVGDRTIVRANDTVVPAFRVDMDFRGLQTTSWVTDTGEVVREESPLGLITVREPAERAQGLSVSYSNAGGPAPGGSGRAPDHGTDRRATRRSSLEAAARRRNAVGRRGRWSGSAD